jgi:hypothetical protein
MTTRLILAGLAAAVLGIAPAAPPPKDSAAVLDETVDAEAAGGTDQQKAAARKTSANNLKQIALAFHNSSDANNRTWPGGIYDANGKALLSWRVQILPYLEQDALYKQFKLDEPWDSKNNLPLVEKMPAVFDSPRVKVKKGYTVYQGFAGDGALFGNANPLRFPHSFTDGTSNTILAVEATTAVPWTKPADVPYDAKKDLPDFGKAFDSTPLACICDGSVRVIDTRKVSQATLKAAITPNGGEVLGPDWNN